MGMRGKFVDHLRASDCVQSARILMLIMIFHTSNDKVDYCEDNDGDNYQDLHIFNKLSMKVTIWRITITSCERRLLATLSFSMAADISIECIVLFSNNFSHFAIQILSH